MQYLSIFDIYSLFLLSYIFSIYNFSFIVKVNELKSSFNIFLPYLFIEKLGIILSSNPSSEILSFFAADLNADLEVFFI